MAHSKWGNPEERAARRAAYHAALAAGCDGYDAGFQPGWRNEGYHRMRWWWSPPWKVTRPWLPRVLRFSHGDEFCNDTILVVLPLLGDIVVRYRQELRYYPCEECIANAGHQPCRYCGTLYCPSISLPSAPQG